MNRVAYLGARLVAVGILFAMRTAPAAADARPFTVMSYNVLNADWPNGNLSVRWEYRRDLVFAVIRAAAPDVIGLQEVNAYQYAEFRNGFPDYDVCWGAARTDHSTTVGNAIMFKRGRFAAVGSCGAANYEGQRRNRVWVRLRDHIDLDHNELLFVSTHYELEPEPREAASKELVAFVGETNVPVVLVGDFNAWSDPWRNQVDEPLRQQRYGALDLLTAAGFDNLIWPLLNDPSKYSTAFSPGYRIDHVFGRGIQNAEGPFIVGNRISPYDKKLPVVSSRLSVELGESGDSYPSDHFAIGVSVTLPDP